MVRARPPRLEPPDDRVPGGRAHRPDPADAGAAGATDRGGRLSRRAAGADPGRRRRSRSRTASRPTAGTRITGAGWVPRMAGCPRWTLREALHAEGIPSSPATSRSTGTRPIATEIARLGGRGARSPARTPSGRPRTRSWCSRCRSCMGPTADLDDVVRAVAKVAAVRAETPGWVGPRDEDRGGPGRDHAPARAADGRVRGADQRRDRNARSTPGARPRRGGLGRDRGLPRRGRPAPDRRRLQAIVADQVLEASGIPRDRLQLVGTHTHSGPALVESSEHERTIGERIAEAVAVAWTDRRAARAAVGVGSSPGDRRKPPPRRAVPSTIG